MKMTYNQIENTQEMHARKLHPATIIFEFIKIIKETIFGFGIGIILTLKESFFYFIIFASIFLVVLIIFSIISWARFTYRVENDELRIDQGVFIRKKRYLSIHRIHKIDLTANVIHRLFGLVKVQIDSASNSGGAEVYLSAVKLSDARQLRRILKKGNFVEAENTDSSNEIKEKITWKRLFIAGSTSGSAGVIVIAVLTAFTQIEELIPRRAFNFVYHWIVDLGFLFIILAIILLGFILWIFGIAGTMIRYGNFVIEKRKDELFIKRGLLETKELTIPFDRIQAIGIEQSIVRQPFGYVRIFAVVAGGSFDKLEAFPVIFPLIHERELTRFINEFLPSYEPITNTPLRPLAKKGLKYYVFKAIIFPLLLAIPVIYLLPSYSWIPLVILALFSILGYAQYQDAGYELVDASVILRTRTLQKRIIMTSRRRIQSMQTRQHRLQKYDNIVSISISLLGSEGLGTHYAIQHMKESDGLRMMKWYSYRKHEEINNGM